MSLVIQCVPSPEQVNDRLARGKTREEAYKIHNYKLKLGKKNPFRDFAGKQDDINRLVISKRVIAVATGKELAVIRTHMKNLRWPISSVEPVVWTGDDARFIALNFEF